MTDIIIVGRGLAGTLLALELEKIGRRVLIIDDRLRDAASPVAAGLINPVTGKRLVPTTGAAEFIPFAISTFRALEQKLGRSFFRELPVFRAYDNAEEIALKTKRAGDPAHARWFGEDLAPDAVHPALHAPLGGFMIVGGGRVDLPAFLEATGEYFSVGRALERAANDDTPPARARARSTGTIRLLDAPFVHAELEILPSGAGVVYRGMSARHIVFAEGAAVKSNPWFGGLAWQPAKGEFITCEIPPDDLPDCAWKIGLSAIPLGPGLRMVGSNYEWNTLDTTPTPAVREALLAGFLKMFRTPPGRVTVIEHRAGIRPAASGAKPIVGPHAEFPALHVFNGFGAKGCTWAPTYARDYARRLM